MSYLHDETERANITTRVWAARVAATAMDYQDRVSVVIPALDPNLRWEDCRWQPRGDFVPPKRGDEGVVVIDNNSELWLVAWWPEIAEPTFPVQNDKWLNGVGGAAVWAPLTRVTQTALTGSNRDVPWTGGGVSNLFDIALASLTGTTSWRSYGKPAGGGGVQLVIRNYGGGGNLLTLRQNMTGGPGTSAPFFMTSANAQDVTLSSGDSVIFTYDSVYNLWIETSRDVQIVAGTSPPTSPVDGQEWVWLYGGAISWKFRYNASSSSPYKWEFIGGPFAGGNAGQGVWTYISSTGTMLDLGCRVTGLRAGHYQAFTGAQCQGGTVGSFIQLGLGNNAGGGSVNAPDAAGISVAGSMFNLNNSGLVPDVPAGGDVRALYYATNSDQYVANMWIHVIPVKIS